MIRSSYLYDHLRNIGIAAPLNRTLRFLQPTYGTPGRVNKRPYNAGPLVPPNVSVQNQVNLYGPFPSLYGTFRYFPPYGGMPYIDPRQEITSLYILGYGQMDMLEFWLGNQQVFPAGLTGSTVGLDPKLDVYIEARYGLPGDTPMTLFPNEAIPSVLGLRLTTVAYTATAKPADEVVIMFTFPNGLYQQNPTTNQYEQYTVQVNIAYAPADSSGNPIGAFTVVPPVVTTSQNPIAITTGTRITFPSRGMYTIKVARQIPQSSDSNVSDECDWQQMVTIVNEDPVPPLYNYDGTLIPIAKVAVRALSTGGRSQSLDNFSVTCKRHLPVWNGTSWVTQATSNPAWALVDQYCGQQNKKSIPLSRFNAADMLAWANKCDALGLQFNNVYDQGQSASQCSTDIATAGRASFVQKNGVYSVFHDTTDTNLVQLFTPRNTFNLSFTAQNIRMPHALRVQWTNPAILYQQDEINVFADGYNQDGSGGKVKATLYDTFQLVGVTSAQQAHILGRYYLACGVLRPRIVQFQTDFEHLVCDVGDLIELCHDVLLIGSGQGYVTAVNTDGSGNVTSVVVDDLIQFEPGQTYTARLRHSDGTFDLRAAVNPSIFSNTITFAIPVPSSSTLPQVGDLVAINTAQFTVTKIEPATEPHLSATITCVDYSPNLFNSDSDNIGTFVSNITLPFAEQNADILPPKIVAIQSSSTVMTQSTDGSFQPRIVITLQNQDPRVTQYEAAYMVSNSGSQWSYLAPVNAVTGQISIAPINPNLQYDIQVRGLTALGIASPWVTQPGYASGGAVNVPPDVSTISLSSGKLIWTSSVIPADFAGYEVRSIAGTTLNWGQATPIVQGKLTVNQLDVSTFPPGTRSYGVKMVNTAGNESADAIWIETNVGDPIVANVILSTDYKAGGFVGTITGGTVTGGNLVQSSTTAMWNADSTVNEWSGTDSDPMWSAGSNADLDYIFEFTVSSSQVPGVISALLTIANGDGWTLQYRKQGSNPNEWSGTDSNPFWSGTDSNPMWTATFTEWLDFPGSIDAEAITYQFWLHIPGGTGAAASVTRCIVQNDVPDVLEKFQALGISSSGTRVPITKTFKQILTVNVTMTGGAVGGLSPNAQDHVTTIGAGPLIKIFNGSSTAVSGTVDVTVQGY